MYVQRGTVYNSRDLEPTQMPIDDRLNKEHVAHIYHGILCSHKKGWVHILCRDMDESGNHHSQQTDTRTENQTPHVLTHRWVLNNENLWTRGRGASHTGISRGWARGGTVMEWGGWGVYLVEMPDIDDGGWRQQTTLPCMYLCNHPAWSVHVPQNLKYN